MQGEGLQLLSGEKLRTLQEQIDSALASLAGVKEESKEKKKMVRPCSHVPLLLSFELILF